MLPRASRRQTDLHFHCEKMMMINVDHGLEETVGSLKMACAAGWVTHKTS